jgi:transposase-like protein
MTKDEQRRLTAWRWRLLNHASAGSRGVAGTCRHFGVSRKTFYKWRKRLADQGVAALCDQPRTPRTSPHGRAPR